ncbi:MAG: carboxypeptidase regulatory-like domain-containing protein [Gemmatimonadota bacterium]
MNKHIRLHRRTAAWAFLLLVLAVGEGVDASNARAQSASLQGIVLDASNTQPVRGATVTLKQGEQEVRGVETDRNGLFQFSGIEPGRYTLRIEALGYVTHEETLVLKSGETRTANRSLKVEPVQLEGINVVSQGAGAVRRKLGVQIITSQELAQIPTPAATGDLMSYLKTQPGVVGTGDRGGQLFIRGGTPSQNLVLMDGMLVYEPFHITGLFSAFPENLIQSADFLPGGFGAKYSGRMGSVLDVQMRDGDRHETKATGSVSPFLAAASVEGPFFQKGRDSYLVSIRRSLIQETSPWLYGQKQLLGFDSEYFRTSELSPDGGARCALTLFRSRDRGGLDPNDPVSHVGWTNLVIGGRCTKLVGATFVDVKFGRSALSSEAVTRGASNFSSSASQVFTDADLSRKIGPVRLNSGGHIHLEDTRYDLRNLLAANAKADESWGEVGVYGELEIPVVAGLRLLPGATFTLTEDRRPFVEPRLRATWQVEPLDGELNGAVGLYEQQLAGISDQRDASSVFTAWVRTPPGARMRSLHAQASWEQSLGGGLSYSVDAYYRKMSDITVATWSTSAQFVPDLAVANGRSRGADARIELRHGPLYLFGGYAYSWTEYSSAQDAFSVWFGQPVQTYHPPHDRRDQVNALASLVLGRYTLSASFEYGSGFPFTRPIGFDQLIDFRTDTNELPDVRRTFGETQVLLERPYNGRLPPTHRLDISVKRPVDIGSQEIQLQAGAINVYDQTNIFYYDVFTGRRINQLPLTPYVSVKLQTRSPSRP